MPTSERTSRDLAQRRPGRRQGPRPGRWAARLLVLTIATMAGLWWWTGVASACGGLFCQNDPVDQAGERILFTVNGDGTITSLIEIQYTGSAADFSWILPMPSAITAEDVAVPDEGDLVFGELHDLTDVRIIAPETPPCADVDFDMATAESAEDSGVEVFASGEVGPFGFDVIGSEDSTALITWLRDNNYRVEPPMEPLIDVYVEEQSAFLAMRLLDGEDSDSIQPIEVTYEAHLPSIPLRLTAVAAQDQMPVWVWIFAGQQAVPDNYAHMEIATEELTFSTFGGNDYRFLVQQRADALDGQAFITEFAGPSNSIELSHPYLQNAARQHPYLTRLATFISPDEMTVDPSFALDGSRSDVSNVRDASGLSGLYDCERDGASESLLTIGSSDAIDPRDDASGLVTAEPGTETVGRAVPTWLLGLIALAILAAITVVVVAAVRRRPA